MISYLQGMLHFGRLLLLASMVSTIYAASSAIDKSNPSSHNKGATVKERTASFPPTRLPASRGNKVGIAVSNSQRDLFVSGAGQNVYFLRVVLEKAGYECDYLTIGNVDNAAFKQMDSSIVLIDDNFDYAAYHTVIAGTAVLTSTQFQAFAAAGAHVVDFHCGNLYATWQQEFLYGRNINYNMVSRSSQHANAIWFIKPFEYQRDYLETIARVPVTMVPHLWSPELIERDRARSALLYDPLSHFDNKVEIVIIEPNLGFSKSAWLPLVVSERLHAQHPGELQKVHVFNLLTDSSKRREAMVDELQISKDGLLERYDRMNIKDLLQFFAKRKSQVVILAHQDNHPLNYVYYEALFYGFALVHNSPLLQQYGYYYPNHDVSAAVEQILRACRDHNDHLADYVSRGREYLRAIDPHNPDVVKVYRHLVERGRGQAADRHAKLAIAGKDLRVSSHDGSNSTVTEEANCKQEVCKEPGLQLFW